MAIEYLLVTFPEPRAVLADGVGVGFTNHILMLPGDEYDISLEGNRCAPASRLIALAGTSVVKPMVICFDLEAAVAMPRGALPALAPDIVPAKPRTVRGARVPSNAVATARKKTSKKPVAKRASPVAAKVSAKVNKDA